MTQSLTPSQAVRSSRRTVVKPLADAAARTEATTGAADAADNSMRRETTTLTSGSVASRLASATA
ncbi:MAG: hypothetical protein SFW67_09950, partial [Myxococcaceae bacterium]|nr:hypothetical protein [Myxococcaceae bacterium]